MFSMRSSVGVGSTLALLIVRVMQLAMITAIVQASNSLLLMMLEAKAVRWIDIFLSDLRVLARGHLSSLFLSNSNSSSSATVRTRSFYLSACLI